MNSELEVIKEQLTCLDELTILDLLEITPDMLVERFSDLVVENYDKIQATLHTG